jgi:two-component system KDP operon response regulator KdpE
MNATRLLAVSVDSIYPPVIEDLNEYGISVSRASIGEAVRQMSSDRPDVVLLLSSGELAPHLCEVLSALSGPPLMVAGSPLSSDSMVACLAHGADSVVRLPVPSAELSVRLQALARRTSDVSDAVLRVDTVDGELMLDRDAHVATRCGKSVDLTPTEFRLLWILAEVPGRLLTYQQLLTKVWSEEYVDDIQYVRLYVNYLRNKLEENPRSPRLIVNQWGVGYRLAITDGRVAS